MFRKILVGLVAAAVLLAGVAYLLPRQIHVERTITVERPAADVYPLVASMHRFNEWSPWSTLDPTMQLTYSGPDSGVGSKMAWSGNSKVGVGSDLIVAAIPNERVDVALQFGAQGPARSSFLLVPSSTGTGVTWTLDLDLGMNPIGRYFGLLMDRMIGPDYERGLARLKALAERAPTG